MTLPEISTDAAGLALWVALGTAVCAVLAEWWHSRRIRRVGRLAFGPLGQARVWTRCAPPARVLALTAIAWGLVTLFFIRPRTANYDQIPEGGYRHLVIAWDVSPSMQLDDGGFDMGKQKKRTSAFLLFAHVKAAVVELHAGRDIPCDHEMPVAALGNLVVIRGARSDEKQRHQPPRYRRERQHPRRRGATGPHPRLAKRTEGQAPDPADASTVPPLRQHCADRRAKRNPKGQTGSVSRDLRKGHGLRWVNGATKNAPASWSAVPCTAFVSERRIGWCRPFRVCDPFGCATRD